MARVFLSHSSGDVRQAIGLKQWLVEQIPSLANEIFLDVDAATGVQAGTRWKDALRNANARCEAVICLLSTNWEASQECRVEYRTAENLNKQIFVVRLEPSTGDDLTSEWQRCDLFGGDGAEIAVDIGDGSPVRFAAEGLYRLRDGIREAGIGADSFAWPPPDDPDRAPYRGWEPLEEVDAAVFFGRDAEILRALDALRGMRLSGVASLFVVLGPSGTGKSSFLRAGLLPRLRREDRRFAVCDIVRPERNALTGESGLAASIVATRRAYGMVRPSLGDVKAACLAGDVGRVADWLGEVRQAAADLLTEHDRDGESTGAPTLVLPIDQAEELFSADAGENAEVFLRLLVGVLARCNTGDVGMVVAATIRTDRYEVMQTHPLLTGVRTMLFDELKPMPSTQFKEVITGPAQRSTRGGTPLRVSPVLVERLLAETCEGADTLPILALTMARLYTDYGSSGELTVAHYQTLGGMHHVVQTEIDEVLAGDPGQRTVELGALRAAFIPWLATVNPDNDQPMRRVARFVDLPEESRPLIDALVAKRLMVKDVRDGEVVVEVALESLLRQWDDLAGWLREQRKDLKDADDLERSAAAWADNDADPAWLLSGTRLTDAEALSNTVGFRQRLGAAGDFLAESREAENRRLAEIEQQREAEIRNARERQATAEAYAATLRRRSRILRSVLAVTAVIAVLAVLAGVSFFRASGQAQSRFRQATAQRLASEGLSMLDNSRPGGTVRAFQQLLAARALAATPDDASLYTAIVKTVDTTKVVNTASFVNDVAVSPDGTLIASAGNDGVIRLWDSKTGQPEGESLSGHQDIVWSVAFSPDGKTLVSGSEDHTLRLWDVQARRAIGGPWTGHDDVVRSVAFSPDGQMVVSGSFDRTARLWDVEHGKQIGAPLRGHRGWVFAVAFSPDGHHVATGGYDQTVGVWDVVAGTAIAELKQANTGPINSVAYSPSGRMLVSGSTWGDILQWDPQTGLPEGEPIPLTDNVVSIVFSPDGSTFAVASADTDVLLIDGRAAKGEVTRLSGHESAVFGVAFTPEGRIVSGSRDSTVRVWDAASSRPMHQDQKPFGIAFSPDGAMVASAGIGPAPLTLWDVSDRKVLPAPPVDESHAVMSVAFSPRGNRMAAGLIGGGVLLWETGTFNLIGDAPTGNGGQPAFGVAFSPDGTRLAVLRSNALDSTADAGHREGSVQFYDAVTGRELPGTIHLPGAAGTLMYSADGKRMAVAGNAGYLQLWDPNTGRPSMDPFDVPHDMGISGLAFSPDGRLLATGMNDSTVRFWDVESAQPVGEPLNGHRGAVAAVRFTPDGRLLASAGADRTVRLWDVATRAPYGEPLTGHTEGVPGLVFSPDGKILVSSSTDHTLRVWPATATPEDLCAKLTANMSRRQWSEWVSPDIGYIAVCPDLPIATD